MNLTARAIVTWFILFAVMFTNGAARVLVLQPRLGEERARQLASPTGVALVLVVSWLFVKATPQATSGQLVWIGVGWLAGTLGFEFVFGYFVSGLSWTALLADYNILSGRLWSFVVLSVFLGPWLCGVVARRTF